MRAAPGSAARPCARRRPRADFGSASSHRPCRPAQWSDEFDGKEIDRKKWDFDLGNGFYNYDANQWISGWGNNELQYYTREPDNAFVKDGMLHIRAVKESLHGCGYTSARLKTRKRDGTRAVRQEVRQVRVPREAADRQGRLAGAVDAAAGRQVRPAGRRRARSTSWRPAGQEPTKVLGTLHFGSRWPANTASEQGRTRCPRRARSPTSTSTRVEWEPGEIRWSVDGKVYATQSFWWSSSKADGGKGAKPAKEADLNPWPAPFDQPFYLIMNVAVGGKFLGNPDKTTPFPAEMLVDYVRVYEKVGGYGEPKPRGEGKLPFGKK